jgi:glutamine---fructose-6-phosphate transaminase (isomerizing)
MELEKLRKKFPGGILREKHPFYMADAIGDIPECLDACISNYLLNHIRNSLGKFKPARIFAVGCGTSYNACQAAAYTLQVLLKIPAIALDAFDFELDTPPGIDEKSLVIGISESGQSITTCLSLEKARELGAFTIGISANPKSRLSTSANLGLTDPYLHEIPLGKTRTYLSTALLGMLSGILTQKKDLSDGFIKQINLLIPGLKENSQYWQTTARNIAEKLSNTRTRYIVTGFGAQKANADEIRLKLMEVLGESATSFGLEEFTHGPSACFESDLVVIMLQTDERTLDKAVRIAQGVVFSNASLIVITDRIDADWPESAHLIAVPRLENPALFGQFPVAMAAQYLFYYMALKKGLNPDVNLEDINPGLGDIYAFFFPPGTH